MYKFGIIGLVLIFSFCKQEGKVIASSTFKNKTNDSSSEYRKAGHYKAFKTDIEFLFSGTKDSNNISTTQQKNYAAFISKQDLLTPELLEKIFQYYKDAYKDYKVGWTMGGKISETELEKHLPKPTTPENLKKFITPAIVHIQNPKDAVEGTIGIEFDCTWDIENGLGVLLKNWKVIQVSTAEISYFY
jgi:hypothetical protein